MIAKTIKKLISEGENSNIELKLSFSDEVIISLVAMANRKGGMVIVGVSDNRRISGIKIDKESIARWTNEIKNKTQPYFNSPNF